MTVLTPEKEPEPEEGQEEEQHGYRSWTPEEQGEWDAMYDR